VQEQAIGCVAPRGRVSLYSGLPPGTPPLAFDTNHVHYHELTVSGTSGASPAQTAQALGLIASGAVPVTDLITHHFPLAQFASVLTTVKAPGLPAGCRWPGDQGHHRAMTAASPPQRRHR
jgi:L-iditol 2-dehydrogenase